MPDIESFEEDTNSTTSLRKRVTALKRVLPFTRPYRSKFIAGSILMLLMTGTTVCQPLVFRHIFDINLPAHDTTGVILSSCVYLLLLASATIFRYNHSIILGTAGVSVVNDLKRVVFDKILTFELAYFDKNPVGRSVSRVESDCERLVGIFTTVGLQIISTGLLVVGILAVLYPVDWRLAISLNFIVVAVVTAALLFFKKMRPVFREERAKIAAVTAVVTEFTQGARLLRLLGREEYAENRLSKVNAEKVKLLIGIFFKFTMFFLPLGLLNIAAIGGILWIGADWTRVGAFSVGVVIMFAQYLTQLFQPLFEMTEQLGEIQRALGSADRILELLNRVPVVDNQKSVIALPALTSAIALQNVTFAYDSKKPVLKNISLTIPAGKRIAIVGPTGGGKSTIINLLCRFYDPNNGNIEWDGIDLRSVSQQELRSRIGLVLQDLYLFPGNVEENLKVMRKDIPRSKVQLAIDQLGTGELISKLPNGLETIFAERSANISYGERQLVAFTRALVFNPELLLLDEATSSVDPETERKIEESLQMLLANRTAVIVAHRLSTIRNADSIAVLKGGEIVELGTHDQLLAMGGLYTRLYRIQFPESIHVAA